MLADKYIDKENNNKIRELLINFLTKEEMVALNLTEHDDIDVRL